MKNLLFFRVLEFTAKKSCTVKQRKYLFDDFNEVEFKMRF